VTSRQRRTVAIAGLVVAALIVAYFALRTRVATSAAPVARSEPASNDRKAEPTPGTVRETGASNNNALIPSPAGAGFHTLQLCAYASRELAVAKHLSDCKPYEGVPHFQEFYAQCLNGWMNVSNRKVAAEAALKDAGCGDMADVETRYFEETKRAAKAGDADAQMCYLQGSFGSSSGEPAFAAEDLDEFRRVVPHYVKAALGRGDWRIVQLMTKRSFHPGEGPVTQIPEIGKPETIYKMTKLLRLGASGRYATRLDRQLNGMIHPDLNPEAALPQDVIRRGDAWAQQTFNESFSGVVGLTEPPKVCGPGRGQAEEFELPKL
jgi:hypothetical protein